ncbi:MAG TPA: c-type cytochrome [Bryobacteraceae bacterium]|nr:c-type cytochrome [Bryobacteraceae bacterium]
MLKRVALAVLVLAAAPLFAQDGDAAKGKELVAANGCTRCHRIGDTGSRVGPNLTDIGDRRTPDRLETSILQPDAEVLPENRFVLVTMKDGTTVRGRLLNHDAISVQLLDGKEQLRSIELKDAKGYQILTKGLMPSFQGKLSPEQVKDVVAYLSSLKGSE